MSIRSTMKETILDMLEHTIEKHDYMSLVSVQLKIKAGFYEDNIGSAEKDMKFLRNYKKSYPHISTEINEVIEYLNGIVMMDKMSPEAENW